ncbi:MAG: voltage-gated potassium channel, partial [Myxococcota bacterium]
EAKAEALLFEQGNQQGDTLFLIGDCFDEDTLRAARVDRARGVVAALSDDRDNLLLGLTARALNPDLRIVMRVKDPANAPMLAEVAGAVQVEPAARSGVRMAQEILHPTHLSLVDSIVDSDARRRGIEAFEVDPASLVAGMTLGSAGLQAKTGCVVVGCRGATGGPYRYNPAPDTVLAADVGLLALGSARARRTLRRLLAASKASKHHGGAA